MIIMTGLIIAIKDNWLSCSVKHSCADLLLHIRMLDTSQKVRRFSRGAFRYAVTRVTNVTIGQTVASGSATKYRSGKYIESLDSGRNKDNEKKCWAIFFPVTNVTKGKSMINHPFHHLQYETNVTGFSWSMQKSA